jgi:hypothetical protein
MQISVIGHALHSICYHEIYMIKSLNLYKSSFWLFICICVVSPVNFMEFLNILKPLVAIIYILVRTEEIASEVYYSSLLVLSAVNSGGAWFQMNILKNYW